MAPMADIPMPATAVQRMNIEMPRYRWMTRSPKANYRVKLQTMPKSEVVSWWINFGDTDQCSLPTSTPSL